MVEPRWWWPAIPLGIVWIIALICYIHQYRKYKTIENAAPIIIFSLIFAVIVFVIIGTSNERFTGVYAYYVNGVRVSAGAANLGTNIFLSIFGGILISICMWSGHTSASCISTPFHSHSCRSIFPIAILFSWKNTFLLYFGANTI